MGLKDTLRVMDEMVEAGAMGAYAISGAVAAYNYVEATSTEDLDLLISLPSHGPSGLLTLGPILTYLAQAGYTEFRKEGIVVEGWPVLFLPVASDLDAEALEQATELQEPGRAHRVLRAEHLLAIALVVGRPKDKLRIAQFLAEDAVDHKMLCSILRRHQLSELWSRFCRASGTDDFCRCEE